MSAIGAHNKDRTATKRVFCRNTKITHPKRGVPRAKPCILILKLIFSRIFRQTIMAVIYTYLDLNGICPLHPANHQQLLTSRYRRRSQIWCAGNLRCIPPNKGKGRPAENRRQHPDNTEIPILPPFQQGYYARSNEDSSVEKSFHPESYPDVRNPGFLSGSG